jgi:hypothetical protein
MPDRNRNQRELFGTKIVAHRGREHQRKAKDGVAMRIRYRFSPLSKDERELITLILSEELEIQRWYVIKFGVALNQEILICLQ